MAYQFTQTGQEIQYLLDEAMQLAEEYDSSVSYAVGDYCSHEGTLYRCTTATTGTWDASKWTSNVIVLNALRTLKGRMDTAEGEIDQAQEDISAIKLSLTHITDNGWSVIKYPDGTFEATKATTASVGGGSSWASGWYYHKTGTITMPTCAVTVVSVIATVYSTQLYFIVGTDAFNTGGVIFYVANSVSGSGSLSLCIRITGTWQ